MPGQGVFSNTAPASGTITVLHKDINGQQQIKAINVSNTDIDGDNIALSLNELSKITLPLTGSGNVSLDILDINEKSGYFFLDVDNKIINSVSASNNANIAISPYLTEPFFYNNYNAVLSNAENPESNFLRFDVDRSSGQVRPNNFNAIAGVGEQVFTMNYELATGGITPFIEESDYNTTNNAIHGALTSSVQSFFNNRDLELRVLQFDLERVLGFPQKSVISVPETAYDNSAYTLHATSSLIIQVDDNANFNNANSHRTTHTLATQTYTDRDLNFTYDPLQLSITSGSFTSGNVFVRIKQETEIISFNTSLRQTITFRPFFTSNELALENFLTVSQYFNDQVPYAAPALVQDSSYTDTGLTNARYNGTKTNSADYGGIDPALSATTFQGKEYRLEETSSFICGQSLSDRGELEDYLFIGSGELPGVLSSEVGTITSSALYNSTAGNTAQNIISSNSDNSFLLRGLPQNLATLEVGELLTLTSGSNQETVQVLNILNVTRTFIGLTTTQLNIKEIIVSRAFLGTTAQASFGDQTVVSRFSGTQIFKIEGNRILSVSNKRIWIKDNRTLINTGDRGFVVSSFTCPA